MKALMAVFLMTSSIALAESPAVRVASGAYGHPTYARKLYESPRILAQANALSTEDLKVGYAADPGLQIIVANQSSDIMINLGPRWFIAERDYLFTRAEMLPMFGLKIQLEGKTERVSQPLPPVRNPLREVSSQPIRAFGFEKR